MSGYPVSAPALKVARSVLAAALTGLPVSTKVPIERPNKFITVGRAGGSRNLVTDSPRIVVQVYWLTADSGVGNTEDTCCEAIAALQNAQGTFAEGAFIRGFDNISGPVDFPDPDVPDMERWQFQGDLLISTNYTTPGS